MPTTPTLFISDITLTGSGGPGNKCKLDKVIEFANDGQVIYMDYVHNYGMLNATLLSKGWIMYSAVQELLVLTTVMVGVQLVQCLMEQTEK